MRARRAALDTLRAVHQRDAYANLVLPGLLTSRGMRGPEAARATDLTYGTLRGQGTFDLILDACTERPLAAVDDDVLDALRLGTYQLMGTRVPAHAAVSTTVDIVRQRSGAGAARFTNAVLRQVATADLDGWAQRLAPESAEDPRAHLSLRHLHPRWVVDALADALNSDDARLAAVLAADNTPPRVTLAAIPGRSTVEELVDAGAAAGRWARTAATLPGGDPARVPAVGDGRARVQDEGSQLVTLALAAVEVPGQDDRWLDLCAGPGGKTMLLGGLSAQVGGHLVAADRHQHRAQLVRRAVGEAQLSGTVGVTQVDGTSPAWRPGSFSRVLLDAPCTGLGALRRRPEARWRRRPSDLDTLVPLQRALLQRAVESTARGGVVGYVTCSPHIRETVGVVEHVAAQRGDVTVEDAPSLLPEVPGTRRGRFVQLWPDRHGTDAMFLAILRRTG